MSGVDFAADQPREAGRSPIPDCSPFVGLKSSALSGSERRIRNDGFEVFGNTLAQIGGWF